MAGPEKDNYSDISDSLVKYFNNPGSLYLLMVKGCNNYHDHQQIAFFLDH